MAPQITFTPDPRNYIYQADYDHGLDDDVKTVNEIDEDCKLMSILKVDLDDKDIMENLQETLNSPRTIEAMKTLGIQINDLLPISRRDIYNYFVKREKSREIPQALIDLRYNTLNERRFNRKEMIIEERNNIIRIEKSMQQRTSPYSQSLRGDSLDHRSMEDTRKTIKSFQKSSKIRQQSARHTNLSSQVQTARNAFAMNTTRTEQDNCAASTETGRTRFQNIQDTVKTAIK